MELAGEILTAYPEKGLTFVDMATTILPGFDEAAATYSRAWLELRGVELMGGEPIERIGVDTVLLKSGIELSADVVCVARPTHSPPVPTAIHDCQSPVARYKCVGVMPNTDMLKGSPFAQKLGFRNSIEVNDYLQVTTIAQPLRPVGSPNLSAGPLLLRRWRATHRSTAWGT